MGNPLEILCATGAKCQSCRRQDRHGEMFRASLANAYDMPEGWPKCPHGVTAEDLRIRRGLGDWVAHMLSRLGLKPKKRCGCRRRQEKLNRLGRWIARFWPHAK